MNHEESILQQQCVACFRAKFPQYSMLLIHPINEGSGHAAIDRRRQGIHKAEGAVAGVTDLLFFMSAVYEYQLENDADDDVRYIRYNGLGIEFKTKKGRQSQQQKDFQKMLEAAGYKHVVIRSYDEFRAVINDYIAHVPKNVRREIALAHVMITREAEDREREHFRKAEEKKKRYCITGVSKLTRQREVISVPCSKVNASAILTREKRKAARRRAYLYLRIEIYKGK